MRPTVRLLTETFLGYVYLSTFDGLVPPVWMYAQDALGPTGYEAVFAVWFAPLVLAIPALYRSFSSRYGTAFLRLSCLLGIASFHAPDVYKRMVVVAVGNAFMAILLCVSLWNKDANKRKSFFWGLMLGGLLLQTFRIWFVSFNPLYLHQKMNKFITAIAFFASIAIVEDDFRVEDEPEVIKGSQAETDASSEQTGSPRTNQHWFISGVSVGSSMFLQWVFCNEVSVLCRWCGTPYPNRGAVPNPHGLLVLFASVLGLLLGLIRPSLASQPLGWFLALLSSLVLLYTRSYPCFLAGIFLVLYLALSAPALYQRASQCAPAPTILAALATKLLGGVALVWVTAYNFVPYGIYARERTDVVVLVAMVTIFLGLFSYKLKPENSNLEFPSKSKVYKLIKVLTIGVFLLGAAGFAFRYPNLVKKSSGQTGRDSLTVGVWAFRLGYRNDGFPNIGAAVQLIRETEADVFSVIESDSSKPFMGNNDNCAYFEESLGWYCDFGPSTKDHTWGVMLLSRYPIVSSKHHLLPSPEGELAPGISAVIDVLGEKVEIVTAHFGNHRDNLDRELQAKYIAKLTRNSRLPIVYVGYLTSKPGGRDYNEMTINGNLRDIDPSDAQRWCLYVLYNRLVRVGYARISHGALSDTEVQLGRFALPGSRSEPDMVTTVSEEHVAESRRFSSAFGGFSYGHNSGPLNRYHMGTPKYFIPNTKN